jgi:phospholipase/lecithinase/hemolysin
MKYKALRNLSLILRSFLIGSLFFISSLLRAEDFKGLIAFGDSLSDTGNIFKDFGELYPPTHLYWKGRQTNGEVWIEKVAASLHLPLFNFAYSGATTSSFFPFMNTNPNLLQQMHMMERLPERPIILPHKTLLLKNIKSFQADVAQKNLSQYMVSLWIGGNNYFFSHEEPKKIVEGIFQVMLRLMNDYGVRSFIIPNMPLLGMVPFIFQNEGQPEKSISYFNSISFYHNRYLAEKLKILRDSPHLDLFEVDIQTYFQKLLDVRNGEVKEGEDILRPCLFGDLIQMPSQETLKKIDLHKPFDKLCQMAPLSFYYPTKYLTDIAFHFISSKKFCKKPDERVFWDAIHPSAKVHCFIAAKTLELIFKKYKEKYKGLDDRLEGFSVTQLCESLQHKLPLD